MISSRQPSGGVGVRRFLDSVTLSLRTPSMLSFRRTAILRSPFAQPAHSLPNGAPMPAVSPIAEAGMPMGCSTDGGQSCPPLVTSWTI
jgi:hypothetical protein